MKKCFEAIYRLDFGEEGSRMVQGMISPEGEKVKFIKLTSTKGEVETWLFSVQENMIETLFKAMKTGKTDHDTKERKVWVMEHPA
jgi:dynein heavy chain